MVKRDRKVFAEHLRDQKALVVAAFSKTRRVQRYRNDQVMVFDRQVVITGKNQHLFSEKKSQSGFVPVFKKVKQFLQRFVKKKDPVSAVKLQI